MRRGRRKCRVGAGGRGWEPQAKRRRRARHASRACTRPPSPEGDAADDAVDDGSRCLGGSVTEAAACPCARGRIYATPTALIGRGVPGREGRPGHQGPSPSRQRATSRPTGARPSSSATSSGALDADDEPAAPANRRREVIWCAHRFSVRGAAPARARLGSQPLARARAPAREARATPGPRPARPRTWLADLHLR
jgi:hypothetical protein